MEHKDFLKKMINLKNSNTPFLMTKNAVQNTITDMNRFPYNRFYRGQVGNTHPTVMSREAGYCPVEKSITNVFPDSVVVFINGFPKTTIQKVNYGCPYGIP